MKTSTASILFALSAALAVSSIPVRPEVQELSARSSIPGIELRRGDDSIARRSSSSFRHRRDDITMIEARHVTIEEREPGNPLPIRAVSSTSTSTISAKETITATAAGSFYRENDAAKRTLQLSGANTTSSTHREVPVKREAEPKKTVEPNCFDASSSEDLGCTVNLSG